MPTGRWVEDPGAPGQPVRRRWAEPGPPPSSGSAGRMEWRAPGNSIAATEIPLLPCDLRDAVSGTCR